MTVLTNETPRQLTGLGIHNATSAIRQHMHLYGYELLELPIIDKSELFLIKAGDQIINSMFTFDRLNKQLALRPEFTASATHYYVDRKLQTVARWQFAGPIFEDRGGKYEQLGIGAELIGLHGNIADAEIISMSALGLEAFEVLDWEISIGHIGLIKDLLAQFSLDLRTQRFLLHNIDRLQQGNAGSDWLLTHFDENIAKQSDSLPTRISNSDQVAAIGGRTYEEIVKRMELKQRRGADREKFREALNFMTQWCQLIGAPALTLEKLLHHIPPNNSAAIDKVNNWKAMIRLIEQEGVPLSRIVIRPGLVRNWEYYTGYVFELYSRDVHIGGGGRYDELARLVGSSYNVPAVGFTYYGDQLLSILPSKYFEALNSLQVLYREAEVLACTKWASILRAQDVSVQMLPIQHGIPANEYYAVVEADSAIRYANKTFHFDQVDQLISELK